MTGIDNNAKLPIQCPQCKREFTKTIRELKGSGVKCPHCGADVPCSLFFDNEVECPGCGKKFLKPSSK